MMKTCDFCGWNHPAETGIGREVGGYTVCDDCLLSIVENEAERRGEREEQRRFESYWSGGITPDDIDRKHLKDAGR